MSGRTFVNTESLAPQRRVSWQDEQSSTQVERTGQSAKLKRSEVEMEPTHDKAPKDPQDPPESGGKAQRLKSRSKSSPERRQHILERRAQARVKLLKQAYGERTGTRSVKDTAINVKEEGFDLAKGIHKVGNLPIDAVADKMKGVSTGGDYHLSTAEMVKGGSSALYGGVALACAIAQTVRVHEMNKEEASAKATLKEYEQVQKLVQKRDDLQGKLQLARVKHQKLDGRLKSVESRISELAKKGKTSKTLTEKRDQLKQQVATARWQVKSLTKRFNKVDGDPRLAKLHSMALKGFLAGKTLESDVRPGLRKIHLERAKCAGNWLELPKHVVDATRLTATLSTGASTVLKGVSGGVGGALGLFTFGTDLKATIDNSREAHELIAKREKYKTARDGETDRTLDMLGKRLQMKATKNRHTKIAGAVKYATGATAGLGSAVAGGIVLAGVITGTTLAAAAIATPVGWALGGLAAVALIGYGCYRLARHFRSKGVKEKVDLALDTLEKNIKPEDMTDKQRKAVYFMIQKGKKHGVAPLNYKTLAAFTLDYRVSRDTRTASATAVLMLKEAFKKAKPDGVVTKDDVAANKSPITQMLRRLGADDEFISHLLGAGRENPDDPSLAQKALNKKFGLR